MEIQMRFKKAEKAFPVGTHHVSSIQQLFGFIQWVEISGAQISDQNTLKHTVEGLLYEHLWGTKKISVPGAQASYENVKIQSLYGS